MAFPRSWGGEGFPLFNFQSLRGVYPGEFSACQGFGLLFCLGSIHYQVGSVKASIPFCDLFAWFCAFAKGIGKKEPQYFRMFWTVVLGRKFSNEPRGNEFQQDEACGIINSFWFRQVFRCLSIVLIFRFIFRHLQMLIPVWGSRGVEKCVPIGKWSFLSEKQQGEARTPENISMVGARNDCSETIYLGKVSVFPFLLLFRYLFFFVSGERGWDCFFLKYIYILHRDRRDKVVDARNSDPPRYLHKGFGVGTVIAVAFLCGWALWGKNGWIENRWFVKNIWFSPLFFYIGEGWENMSGINRCVAP